MTTLLLFFDEDDRCLNGSVGDAFAFQDLARTWVACILLILAAINLYRFFVRINDYM